MRRQAAESKHLNNTGIQNGRVNMIQPHFRVVSDGLMS